jgi:hypothetical protein
VISVKEDILTVLRWRSHLPWSRPEEVANYPLVNIREYHFDSVRLDSQLEFAGGAAE